MNWLRLCAGLLLLMCMLRPNSYGQGFAPVEARISSVSGSVLFCGGASDHGTMASRGQALSPGNMIVTTGGGRAVVALTDGSIVIVQPGSVVIFKDFHQADSLRELFAITLGQVRVKINHFAGKPNPYRMNSPTASIAVRGTEFTITVDRTGNTRVVVFDGAVEVSSLGDPSRKTLIERGQGVLVAPGFDFQMFTPSAGDLADRAKQGTSDRPAGTNEKAAAASGANGLPGGNGATGGSGSPQPFGGGASGQAAADRDSQTPRSQAGTYERYIAGLESLNGLPLLLRFNALPEGYLDSAENPAYATGFRAAEARLYALPAAGGTPQSLETFVGSGANAPANFAGSTQFSAFVPIDKGRFVLGGSATASYFTNGSLTSVGGPAEQTDLGSIVGAGPAVSTGKSISRFFAGSVLLATKIGANSFGLQVETLKGTGSLTSVTPDLDDPGQAPSQDSLTRSNILQTRFTLGFQRNITPRHTLGAFVRYGLIDAKNSDVFNYFQSDPQALSQTDSPGHTAEVGVRLRGEIRPKLYYGLEAAALGLSLRDALKTGGAPSSQQRDRANRESAGFGLLYMPARRTMLVGDFAFGVSDIGAVRQQHGSGLLLQNGTADSHFESLHIALQREIGTRYFLLASFMNVWQGNSLTYAVFPDSAGTAQPFSDALFSTSPTSYLSPGHLSDFGGGVRLSQDLLAQYIFSTNYGFSSPSHTLMLRYTFRAKR